MKIKSGDKVITSRKGEILTYLCVTEKEYDTLIKKDQRTNYIVVGHSHHEMLSSLDMFEISSRCFKTKSGVLTAFEKTQILEIIPKRSKFIKSLCYITTLVSKVCSSKIKSMK